MSGAEAKQRLVKLDIDEVSLVGTPANEQPFVVTKAKTPTQEPTMAQGATLAPAVAQKVTLQYLQDLVWEIGRDIQDPTKRAEAMAKLEEASKMLDQVKQLTTSIAKAATDISTEIKKAKESTDDKKVPAFMKEAVGKLLTTLKEAVGEDEPDGDEAKAKALDVALATVAKAGKAQFSKERMAKLNEAFMNMGEMYKSVDSEGFTKAVEAWGTPSPAATTIAPPAPVAAGEVKKGDEAPAWFTNAIGDVKKSVDAVAEQTKAVAKRVEAVEKVEAVSKALPQSTDGKPVEKGGGFWKGLL